MIHRIVEYATREQAQAAVAQLSNQNLMGRLVYVREVSNNSCNPMEGTKLTESRTVKLSLGSSELLAETAVALQAAQAVCLVISTLDMAVVPPAEVLVVAAVRSMWPTFVQPWFVCKCWMSVDVR
jgi:hypothetical protein